MALKGSHNNNPAKIIQRLRLTVRVCSDKLQIKHPAFLFLSDFYFY